MKNNRVKLCTKISLVFGLVIFSISITILLFINISVQNSLKNQPVIKSSASNMISVTLNKDMENQLSYYFPVTSKEFLEQIKNAEISADRLDQILRVEVITRIIKYSMVTAIVVGLLSFLLSNWITRKLMRPLMDMVKVTQTVSLQNLDERIELPGADDETAKLIVAYNHMLDRLKVVFSDLDEFNAYASHELRNSMAILRSCLEEIKNNPDGNPDINLALVYVSNLSKTVDEIMAISARQLKDKGEYSDLALLAAQAADEYLITGRDIRLYIPEDGVMPVDGKELWLYRAVCNLLDNAIKNSPEDSVINIRLKQCINAVLLEVENQGEGIAEAELEDIWKPYYTKSSTGRKGTGLGLTMVYHVINKLGGIVWAESRAGRGTCFCLSLPAADY